MPILYPNSISICPIVMTLIAVEDLLRLMRPHCLVAEAEVVDRECRIGCAAPNVNMYVKSYQMRDKRNDLGNVYVSRGKCKRCKTLTSPS